MNHSSVRILLLILVICISQPAKAVRTDVVYLHNGDRVTGEVKSLFRGKLEFKTDHMGTLFIEWTDIEEIVSDTGQAIELANGQRFYGPLAKPESKETVVVNTEQGLVGLNPLDVIGMYPVESSFWQRLDFSASLGFSWDKGSGVGKTNFGIDTVYRRPQSISRVSLSTEITTQERAEDTSRSSLTGQHNIFMPNKKFRTYFGNLEQNDQLGVDFRGLLGAGYGWVPVRSQKDWFSLAAGLDVNYEVPTTGDAQTNLEAVGMLVYEYYKYSSPQRSFKTNFLVFPSLTDFGRWRASLNTDFKFEIVGDLFWLMELYAEYDSAPISQEGATSDYGVVSSLGYKF